jgi:hypothetical protein
VSVAPNMTLRSPFDQASDAASAQYGQHRTIGTRYCLRECGKAQAARECRRRDGQDQM